MSRIQKTTGRQYSNDLETAELTHTLPAQVSKRRTQSGSHSQTQGNPRRQRLKLAFRGLGALALGAIAAFNPNFVQILDRQTQSLFLELRGPIASPDNIVILAIDDSSLSQADIYAQDPVRFADLEPIQSWPWRRQAYAEVIERLFAAGAKSVSLDLVLSAPSSYGPQDDEALAQVLQRHTGRVVLAEQFVSTDNLLQGSLFQRDMPLEDFQTAGATTGFINLMLEPDSQVHRFGLAFLDQIQRQDPLFRLLLEDETVTPSFATATLQAAQATQSPETAQHHIQFYGPNNSFTQIPFWQVLDNTSWNAVNGGGAQFQQQFKDKIVLIGSTAPLQQDFHPAPFGHTGLYQQQLFGVEIQANAIASLQERGAIADPFLHQPWGRGLLLALLGIGASQLLRRPRQPLLRLGGGFVLATAWGLVGFGVLALGRIIVPTALPILALVGLGSTHFVSALLREQRQRKKLRQALKAHASVPAVQQIIRQEDLDLIDLIQEREAEVIGKILNNRYRIAKVLGTGGFSETYVAQDTHRPGDPTCVVKQLRLVQGKPGKIELVRRLFLLEAETLERLGQHSQIPQLLAYFEEDYEFYLVQELIEGQSLHDELIRKARLPLYAIMQLLYDVLVVLDFVHGHQIIHRDIKPHNLIRRSQDSQFVLIDFGVAKKLSDRLQTDTRTQLTVAIGTQGYISREQIAGKPNFASDLYSLGVTTIEALTGLIPRQFQFDEEGEISWTHRADFISDELQGFLQRLVRADYTQRYPSAQEALLALQQVPEFALLKEERPQVIPTGTVNRLFQSFEDETEDASADTQIWQREEP